MEYKYQFEALGPTLNVIVLIFLILFALITLGLLVVVAALPGRIARSRQHAQADAINVCGWLGLPTGILWVFAMVWAYTRSGTASPSSGSDYRRLKQQLESLEQALSGLETACVPIVSRNLDSASGKGRS